MTKHWPRLKLGDVLIEQKQRIGTFDADGLPLLGVSNQEGLHRSGMPRISDMSRYLRVEKEWFAYNPMRINVGSIGWAETLDQTGIISPDYVVFSCSDRILPRLLFSYLKHRQGLKAINDATAGSVRERLYFDSLAQIEFPLPPLAEQRRVAARVEELAAQIHEARTLRRESAEETDALLQSLLHEQFVRGSAGWQPLPMEHAIAINDSQVNPTLPEFSELPHISGDNMEKGTCRLLPYYSAEQDGVRSGNYRFGPGTVLYSKIRPYLRKAVYVDFGGLCSADVYPIKVVSSKLDARFVMWSLVAEPFTEYANRLSGRTRMPKLNRKQLFAFSLIHPPIAEQRKIVAGLDALQTEVDSLKRLQVETAAELDALLPAILDRAFKGEI